MKTLLIFVLSLSTMCMNIQQTRANNLGNNDILAMTSVNFSAPEKERAVTVTIMNAFKESIEILLVDENDIVLYNEDLTNVENYAKKLNLSQIENGKYHITVARKLKKTIQPFELTESGVQLIKNERKEIFLPYIVQKGSFVDVNCMAPNYTNIYIRIFDNEGKLVKEDKNYFVFDLKKRFDLSKLQSGVYFIEVSFDDETKFLTIKL